MEQNLAQDLYDMLKKYEISYSEGIEACKILIDNLTAMAMCQKIVD